MTGIRVLFRLAARDARRDRGRSLLVLIMVVLPVAGLVGVITFGDTVTPSAERNATQRLGSADALAFVAGPDAALDGLLEAVPAGADVEVVTYTAGSVAADGRFRSVQLSDQDLSDDGFGVGGHELVDGALPDTDDEVVVSRSLADAVGVGPGDVLDLDPLGEVTVSGLIVHPSRLSSLVVVTAPAALAGTGELSDATVFLAGADGALASDPAGTLGPVAVDEFGDDLPADAWYVESRDAVLAQGSVSQGERWALLVVGGLAGVEVALVAGAAFAVSVRRRQRELGLLAAGGGTTRHVRTAVLLTGVTVGVGGALLGAALGVVGAWALTLTPFVERVLDRQVSGLVVDPMWIVLCIAMGAGAAVIGAWWPARTVARLPVLVALSGRRPVTVPSRRTATWGVVVAVAGALLTLATAGGIGTLTPFVFLGGSVLVVLGAGLTSPFLLESLGRLAGRLPTGPRLAVRDAARFRTRNGPIVTAAMAGLAASVTLAAGLGTVHAADIADYRPYLPDEVAALEGGDRSLEAAAPIAAGALDAEVIAVGRLDLVISGADDARLFPSAVAPDDAVRLYGEEVGDALARGEVIVRDEAATGTGPWTVSVPDPTTGDAGETLGDIVVDTISGPAPDAVADPDASAGVSPFSGLPQVLIAPDTVTSLGGAETVGTSFLLVGDAPFTAAQVDAAAAAVAAVGDDAALRVEEGPSPMMLRVQWAATGIGTLAGLLIVVVAISLAATEARADGRTLAAVGAGARTRRSVAAGRALLLSGLGGLLAVPVGMVPALAILSTAGLSVPVVIPWVTIAIVAVGVPAVTTLGAVVAASVGGDRLTRAV